jgi:uncharacterized integral membrane protein
MMPSKNANTFAWVALAAGVVTMVLVAVIVRTDGPMGEVGSSEFWTIFAAVLAGSVIMLAALARAVMVQKGSRRSEHKLDH